MSPIASPESYIPTLLYDIGKRGHLTGDIALSPGKHAVHDGRYIDIAPSSHCSPSAIPVNPYANNERSPGLMAYMYPMPVMRLPPNVPTHMKIKSLHIDSHADFRLQGSVGGANRQPLPYTHGPLPLASQLNELNAHFVDICSKVSEHPGFSDFEAFDLDHTDLTWTFPGGPELKFDAEGRLPFCGLRSNHTEVTLCPSRDPAQPDAAPTLRIRHTCTLLGKPGPDRTVTVELYASLAAPQPHHGAEPDNGVQEQTQETNAAPAGEEKASYCAAIYAGLLDTCNISGHVSLAKRDWTDVAKLFPKAATQLQGWRIKCRTTARIHVRREGDALHMRADAPIRLRLPEHVIPVGIGWIRRLLSRLLVVVIEQASISLPTQGDAREPLPLMIHKARLQLGFIPLPFIRVHRQVTLPPLPQTELFTQIDHAAAKIARAYTFGPLVNLSHLTDLSQSNFLAKSDRHCLCKLSDTSTLYGKATSLYLGKGLGDAVEGRIAIDHDAQLVSADQARNVRMGAAVTIEGGALAVQPYTDEEPPGPSADFAWNDGSLSLWASPGPEAAHTLRHAATDGLKALAGRAAGTLRKVGPFKAQRPTDIAADTSQAPAAQPSTDEARQPPAPEVELEAPPRNLPRTDASEPGDAALQEPETPAAQPLSQEAPVAPSVHFDLDNGSAVQVNLGPDATRKVLRGTRRALGLAAGGLKSLGKRGIHAFHDASESRWP